MIVFLEHLVRPFLRALDAEDAHRLTINALKRLPLPAPAPDDPRLSVRAFGLTFPNPIGIAAGFDKNAEVPDAMLRLGFGFAEIGTVTPQPQTGNPRPRLFRLLADEGVINRLGFNNEGMSAVRARLQSRKQTGIVGVNVGANKDAIDRIADYALGVEAFVDVASYFTINISSPNTPGLRDLQQAAALDELLGRVLDARERVTDKAPRRPVLLKIAPDLTLVELDEVVGVARRHRIDGMIVGNTTISRPQSLCDTATAIETGGLSGKPLFPLATRMLAETYVRVEGAFPLIGVGGIDSGAAAVAKMRAGASLIQLYSGLVFRGLGLVREIKSTLVGAMAQEKAKSLADLVGLDAAARTAEEWPN